MGFELLAPAPRMDGIKAGECSIDKSGNIRLNAEDARSVGIGHHVAVLIDRATRRVALRAPTEDEPALSFKWSKSKTVGTASIKRALSEFFDDFGRCKGRRSLVHKDNLLIVEFGVQ